MSAVLEPRHAAGGKEVDVNVKLAFSKKLQVVTNRIHSTQNVKYLIIETAFSNKEREIAAASKHLCPDMLAVELKKMRAEPEVYITHLKPGEGALTMKEIGQAAGRWRPRMLENNQEFSL